ncbi:hypothetical protein ES703_41716 [subsurface metagenome]|nr:hypothetical protein [bacterium]
MAISYKFYKANEQRVKRMALVYLNTFDKPHHRRVYKWAEKQLEDWGFSAFNLMGLATGIIEYEYP